MTPQQWQEVDRLFQHAVELSPEDRDSFLDEACSGDAALRKEVDSLLASDASASHLIDQEVLLEAAPFLAVEVARLDDGQKLGNYEIVRLIGRGGMGEVYLARDEILNRRVALKLLPADYTTKPAHLRRFQQEAHAASALNHPNILTIHELRQVEDYQYIATEFVDGETLRERLNRGLPPIPEILDIAIQVATAMAAAHEAGIIHRDIKPENIMLRPDGYVKVLDFGLSKLRQEVDSALAGDVHQDLAASSALIMGTVKYMSPEQARGSAVDQRTDIFSMGVVLYEMTFGAPPFPGSNAAEVIESVLHQEPAALTNSSREVPPRLLTVIRKTLAKDKESRYQSSKELLLDLRDLKGSLDRQSRLHSSGAVRIGSLLLHNRARVAVFALSALVFILGIVAVTYWRLNQKRPVVAWITRAPLPRPRTAAAVATLNQQIYVVSGADDSGTTDSVVVYDPITNQWSPRAPLPTARAHAATAAIEGKLYVFGGCGRNSEGNHDCRVATTAVVEVYDPVTNSWTSRAPMPAARSSMASAVIDGKVYLAGGMGACPPCPASKMLEVYDPHTDTWDTTRAQLPIPQNTPSGAAIDGKFYIVGGAQTLSQKYDETQYLTAYDPISDQWTIKSPLPTSRTFVGVTEVHGQLYVIGGDRNGDSRVVEFYDPRTDRWASGPSMPVVRPGAHPVSLDGIIYLTGCGGPGGNPIATLDAYIPPCPGSVCSSAPAGLIAWWPGDGDFHDIVGASNGQVEGDVTFAPGKVDQAFNFNGSSFITMGNPPALRLTGTQVSMSGWVYPRANTWAIYFGKTRYGFDDYILTFGRGIDGFIRSNGTGLAVLGYADFPANQKLFVPPLNQWTQVALTYDGAQIKVYANGELIGQADKTGALNGDDSPFNIGGRADDEGPPKFNGLIDEVEVFDRTLSPQEIKAIFETGGAGHCKPRKSCS